MIVLCHCHQIDILREQKRTAIHQKPAQNMPTELFNAHPSLPRRGGVGPCHPRGESGVEGAYATLGILVHTYVQIHDTRVQTTHSSTNPGLCCALTTAAFDRSRWLTYHSGGRAEIG